jgi:hypothetical protein
VTKVILDWAKVILDWAKVILDWAMPWWFNGLSQKPRPRPRLRALW